MPVRLNYTILLRFENCQSQYSFPPPPPPLKCSLSTRRGKERGAGKREPAGMAKNFNQMLKRVSINGSNITSL